MSRVYEDHGVEGINLKQVTELSFDIYSRQYLSVYNQFHQSYAELLSGKRTLYGPILYDLAIWLQASPGPDNRYGMSINPASLHEQRQRHSSLKGVRTVWVPRPSLFTIYSVSSTTTQSIVLLILQLELHI